MSLKYKYSIMKDNGSDKKFSKDEKRFYGVYLKIKSSFNTL